MKKYLNLILLIFLILSCVKNETLSQDDYKYLLTTHDLKINDDEFTIRPLKSGKMYYFSKTVNNFGLYSLYSSTVVNKTTNEEFKIKCTANKFYEEYNTKKLFDSNAILLKIYKNETEVIDLDTFNSDNGFYIKSDNYLNLTLKKENILFSIIFEGDYQLYIHDIEGLIIEKIEYLYNTEIDILFPD